MDTYMPSKAHIDRFRHYTFTQVYPNLSLNTVQPIKGRYSEDVEVVTYHLQRNMKEDFSVDTDIEAGIDCSVIVSVERNMQLKQNDHLLYDGYRLLKDRVLPDGSTSWKCSRRDCSRRIKVSQTDVVVVVSEHNRELYPDRNEAIKDVCDIFGPGVSICQNGGTCMNISADNYTCMCPQGFTGKDCHDDWW
ncbi:hypothetical protein CHS0354_014948 [Potamilus streckersoni]|uniref:EGF-like domain-containing protein n=1 Tax=Potamilus streckersoni TaxID=2493646 RepID=A0AAE0S808_9BIVA|nr:hypothetical protein CHS0354_014948 [Potamilus streckersoni]